MIGAWLATAFLAASWLLGLDYFQPAHPVAWMTVLAGAVALLAEFPVVCPSPRQMLVAAILTLPAVGLLPLPYKAIPVLLAGGLLIQFLPLKHSWPRQMGRGAMVAAGFLLCQAMTLWLYALGTARRHELPWPLPQFLSLLPKCWGTETTVDGSTLVLRCGEEIYRIVATWELLFDPATLCCLVGGFTLLGFLCHRAYSSSNWRQAWFRQFPRLLALLFIWAPLRATFLIALVLHRALRADPAGAPNVGDVLVNSWIQVALLGGFVLLAIRFTEIPGLNNLALENTEPPSVPKPITGRSTAAILLVGLGVALLVGLIEWVPVGERLPGRVLVVEKHATWEPTLEPYGTKVYGEKGSYNYAAMYAYCGQYFEMAQLLPTEAIDDAALGRCDVLIIKTPTERYTPDEVAAVVRFVERGGGLLLVGDHTNVFNMNTALNDIAHHFGFTFRHDLLFRVGSPYVQMYQPPWPSHPIVQAMPPMNFAVSCSIDPGCSAGRMVVRNSGLYNLPPAYQEMNYHPQAEYRPNMQYGSWCQIWSTTRGEGRVVAHADSTLFSNFCLYQPGKAELILGMLEWLNRRSLIDRSWLQWVLYVPWGLAGALLLAMGLFLGCRLPAAWIMMVAAGLAGWAGAVQIVSIAHSWAMPVPPILRPLQHVVIDRTLSDVPLFTGAFADSDKGDGYGLFEQWIPRLGGCQSRRAGDEVFLGDALVVICPNRSVPSAYREKLKDYVQAGGRLLVVDDPENKGSTANKLLWSFGLESSTNLPEDILPGKLKLKGHEPQIPLKNSCKITGGETLAWWQDVPVAARIRFGKGTVTAIGIGSLFNDANMGTHWLQEPTPEIRERYEVLYALLRIVLHQ